MSPDWLELMSNEETVIPSILINVPVKVSGIEIGALVDSGALLFIIKKTGRTATFDILVLTMVQSYDGTFEFT